MLTSSTTKKHELAGLKRRQGGPDSSQIFKGKKFENENEIPRPHPPKENMSS